MLGVRPGLLSIFVKIHRPKGSKTFWEPSRIRAEFRCPSRISSRLCVSDFYEHCRQPEQAILRAEFIQAYHRSDMKQTPVCIVCDWLISNSPSKDVCRKIAAMHVRLKAAITWG